MQRLLLLQGVLFIIYAFGVGYAYAYDNIKSFHYQEAEAKSRLISKINTGTHTVAANYTGYDVSYYFLDLELEPNNRSLSGTVTVRARVTANNISAIDLDFASVMTIHGVTENDTALHFTHQNDVLTIDPGRLCGHDEMIKFTIRYSGRPAATGMGSFLFMKHNDMPLIWTQSEPFGARDWWPCKDIPTDKADSVDMKVTVPAEFQVASNGILRQVKDLPDNKKMYWWHESYPIATYLVSLAVFPYEIFSDWSVSSLADSMLLQYYFFPEERDRIQYVNAKIKDMIAIFSALFGAYPFIGEKYGHASVLYGLGMEHQTISSISYATAGNIFTAELQSAHELAHQWWGNMITCADFHHVWLNEGLATYSEALYLEQAYGKMAYHQYMQSLEYYGPGTIYISDPERNGIYNAYTAPLIFDKAAFVLHMLRHVVGDDHFFTILRTFAGSEYRYGNASTGNFQNICDSVAGIDLDAFFRQWIYNEFYPEFQLSWQYQRDEDSTYAVTGSIKQVQNTAGIFETPLDLTIEMGERDTTFILPVDARLENFKFTVPETPTELIVDRDNWVLNQMDYRPEIQIMTARAFEREGDGDGEIEAGESAKIVFYISNYGKRVNDLYSIIASDDPDVIITKNAGFWGQVSPFQEANNENAPFEIKLVAYFKPHIVQFNLQFTGAENYSANFQSKIPLGHPYILAIEDDGDTSYNSGFAAIFDSANVFIRSQSHDAIMAVNDPFNGYSILIWDTGADSNETITARDQERISSYLANGGKLVLFGQNIGRDLVTNGSDTDRTFFENILHARYEADNSGSSALRGVPGDVIGQGIGILLRTNDNQPTQDSPDIIAPGADAVTFLSYVPSMKSAAIRYEAGATRVVYFGISLAGFTGYARPKAIELIGRLFLWLESTATGVTTETEFLTMPEQFKLYQNYPNPFSGNGNRVPGNTTKIQFAVPEPCHVEVMIYNLLGQKIRHLVQDDVDAGLHCTRWNGLDDAGSDLVSGVYLVRMQAGQYNESRKMLKIK